MSVRTGNVGFHVAFAVPNAETGRMESFLRTCFNKAGRLW